VRPVAVVEETRPSEPAAETVRRLALEKARAALRNGEEALVLGADTVVVLGGEVLGKPRDDAEAARMLRRLAGAEHLVITGLALIRSPEGEEETGVARTRVRFRSLDEGEIDSLVEDGEGRDKAGAYGIQGRASLVVEEIEGDYYNVVGLPLVLLRRLIVQAEGT
jgi:septum formation protein